jgi:chitodextrinase
MKPAIVSDASGLAVIAWQDYRSGTNYDLYGQQVNLAGATQWSSGGMAICDAAYDQTSAAAMSDGSGGAIIAWQDSRTGVSKDIYAQSVNSTGSPRWSTGGVAICIAAEDQDCPITMSDASSGAIIAWQDARSNTGLDIYGQRVSPEGTTQWTANGAAISTASGDQSSLSGVSDGAGGAIVAWQDSRNVTKDIYAQRVFASGVLSQPPKQPRNLSPVDGATDTSLTPALRCSAFSTAESGDTHAASQWRIRTAASDYDSPVFDSSTDPFALRQVTLELGYLDGNITYYWQVRHQDEDGEWSLWSEETCFTTCNRAPDQPSGVSPGNGEIDISLTPTLHSSAFSDSDAGDAHTASQWRISAAPGDYSVLAFLSDEVTTDLTQVNVTGGFLTGNTTYFWQVRHKDNHGIWSEWSDEKSFRTLNRPPDRPAPILPAAGATGTDLSLTLESSAFSDPDSGDAHAASQWQLTTMAGDYGIPVFDTVKLTESNPLSVVVPPCTLAPDTTYYWRVRYQDEHGAWSDWSEESSFITLEIPDNHPPDQPACLVPGNGSKNISRMPTLESSTFHDPDAGDSHASSQWQITNMPGEYANPVFNSAAVVGTAPTSIVVPSCVLSPGTTYYWRIRYQDNHGAWSDWSQESSFKTQESPDNTPPDQPTCVAPRNGAENVSTTPTLKSSAFHDPDADDSQGASQWQVTGTPGDYSDPTIDKLETLNSISFPDETLSPETTYCWRVRHQDSHGAWSEWSYESSFATEAEETSGTENGMAASSWIYLGIVAAVAILAAAAIAWRNARANRMAGT